MCSHFDRETFQRLLAKAFAAQQSQISRHSLSDMMEIQRSIAAGTLDLDGVMNRIAESVRNVASASGVAIGLLNGTQLNYRSASGTSSACIGQRVTASLTVSAAPRTSPEILRVEDAQTDTRIEADICRQFGVNSLLMLPIYHNGSVAGVLDVRFTEAHTFEDIEVRTYRLMVEQIEAVMSQTTVEHDELAAEPVPASDVLDDAEYPDSLAPPVRVGESSEPSSSERCAAVPSAASESTLYQKSALFATTMIVRAKNFSRPESLPVSALLATILVLTFTGWVAYRDRRQAIPAESSTVPGPINQAPPTVLAKPQPGQAIFRPEVTTVKEATGSKGAARLVPGDNNEGYDIGDDVTVRVFAPRPAVQRSRMPTSRIAHIGDDVTVRYFTPPQPTVHPVSK